MDDDAPLADRPSGEDFFETEKGDGVGITGVEPMSDCAAQTVVVCECADLRAHDPAGLMRARTHLVTVMGEVQQMAAFCFIKHPWPFGTEWAKDAQKMVNILLKGRTMEAGYA